MILLDFQTILKLYKTMNMAKRGAHQIITSLGMDVDISFAEEFHFQFNLTNTKIP